MTSILAAALLGWATGLMVNYLADVLPVSRRVSYPFCLACRVKIDWINYFFWPRRCPACGQRRSMRVWVVEICFIALAVWMWLLPPARLGFWIGLLLAGFFCIVIVIDVEHRLILHAISLLGALMGIFIGVRLHGLQATLLGGLAGFGVMLFFYFLGIFLVKALARWRNQEIEDGEALGFGDVTLGGVIGLLLGWPGIFAGLTLAIILGGIFSLIYLIIMISLKKYRPDLSIPYGPFLVASAVLLLYMK